MSSSALALLFGIATLVAVPSLAHGFCDDSAKVRLFNRGLTPQQVDQICGGGNSDSGSSSDDSDYDAPAEPRTPPPAVPSYATMCYTQVGACMLSVYAFKGSACACYTYGGTFFGYAK